MELNNKIDQLLSQPCYIIDFLPKQVPAASSGQYFAIAEFYRDNYQSLYNNFADLLLKVNCYYDFKVLGAAEDGWQLNPKPALLRQQIISCAQNKTYLNIISAADNCMFIVCGDDLYLQVYNPDLKLLNLLNLLSQAQGLFLRKAAEYDIHDQIAAELLNDKSVAALVWLLEKGRELEFSYNGGDYFITKSNSDAAISLWAGGKDEQAFSSADDLWQFAEIDNQKLQLIWPQVEIKFLY